MITLSVPGELQYRDVAVRVVGAACKLFGPRRSDRPAAEGHGAVEEEKPRGELADEFVQQVVSAFSEAFNNLAIHGYKGATVGRIDIAVHSRAVDGTTELVIDITDTGQPFDPSGHLEVPDELPERGMGLFIMRSFLDDLRYVEGPPHTLTLVKRWPT